MLVLCEDNVMLACVKLFFFCFFFVFFFTKVYLSLKNGAYDSGWGSSSECESRTSLRSPNKTNM